eukprot:5626086-Prymnesium_polylepis.1
MHARYAARCATTPPQCARSGRRLVGVSRVRAHRLPSRASRAPAPAPVSHCELDGSPPPAFHLPGSESAAPLSPCVRRSPGGALPAPGVGSPAGTGSQLAASPASWSSGSVGSKRGRSLGSFHGSFHASPVPAMSRHRSREATQTESQESVADSLASVASTDDMQFALCALTEGLFSTLLDFTLSHVLQAEASAAAAAGAAGGGATRCWSYWPPGEAGGQADASGGGGSGDGAVDGSRAGMEVEPEEMERMEAEPDEMEMDADFEEMDADAAAAPARAAASASGTTPGVGVQADASGGHGSGDGAVGGSGAGMEAEPEGMEMDVEEMDVDAAAAAAVPAGAAAPASRTAPGAGVRTRGVTAAEAREALLLQRIAELESIKSQLQKDLTELKESAAAQLGALDPEVLHRAAVALEREVEREVAAVGAAALFAGGELEGMTSEQVAVARRANRLQHISADVIDRAMTSEPELAAHLEQSMQRADASKSRDLLPTKMRRAFVLLVLLARLRRSKDATEVLLPWGLTIYLISLHSSPALVEGLRESLQARRAG